DDDEAKFFAGKVHGGSKKATTSETHDGTHDLNAQLLSFKFGSDAPAARGPRRGPPREGGREGGREHREGGREHREGGREHREGGRPPREGGARGGPAGGRGARAGGHARPAASGPRTRVDVNDSSAFPALG